MATEKYFWLVRLTPRTSVLVAKYIRVSGEVARQLEITLSANFSRVMFLEASGCTATEFGDIGVGAFMVEFTIKKPAAHEQW